MDEEHDVQVGVPGVGVPGVGVPGVGGVGARDVGACEIAAASARLGVGAALLVGTGLRELVRAAVAVDDERGATVEPTAHRPPDGWGPVALAASQGAARTLSYAAGAVARAVPRPVREPVGHRLLRLRAVAAVEQERSRQDAQAALEVAARFMTAWIVERLDVDRIVERLRLDDIIAGLELTDVIVAQSGGVSAHVLDNARSRAAGADAVVDRAIGRLRRRSAKVRDDAAGAVVVPPAPA